MDDLIKDWNELVNDNINLNDFVSKHWEKFLSTYIKTMRRRDDSDLYLELYTSIEKMLKLDVVPIFEYPAQLIQYFKHCLINDKINSARAKKIYEVSLDSLKEDIHYEPESNPSFDKNDVDLKLLLCELEKRVSPLQMTVIMLLLKGYTRKEISELLGIKLHTINDRIYRMKEIVQEVLNFC